MDRGDFSGLVDQKSSGQRIDAAEELSCGIIANHHAVIHTQLGQERLNNLPTFVVHGNAKDREASVLIFAFHLGKPGDLYLTWAAPRSEEIQEDDFAPVIRQAYHLAVGIFESEFRRILAVLSTLHAGGFHGVRTGRATFKKATQQDCSGTCSREAQLGHRFLPDLIISTIVSIPQHLRTTRGGFAEKLARG